MQVTVRMPGAADTIKRGKAVAAIASHTSRPIMARFVESTDGRTIVECHAKRIGPKTLERWSIAVFVATR